MIFFHNPYYNFNYTNLNKKKVLVTYALNPKNYTNYIMQFFKKKPQEKNQKPNFKILKLQRFTNRKKNLNFKKQSNKFCKKPKIL